MNNLTAVRAHLAKLPPAISGDGGHSATFRAACECVRLGLSDCDAMLLLGEWNGTHCQPPWSEKELAHKLADARRKTGGGVRRVIRPAPAVRVIWQIHRKIPARTLQPQPHASSPVS